MAIGSSAKLIIRIVTDTAGAAKDLDATAGKLGVLGSAAKSAAALIGPALATGAVVGITKAVNAAADLNETLSASGAIFRDATDEVTAFASQGAKALGQSKAQALEAANTFGTFGKAAGLSGSNLAKFSTGLVSLSTDLASFKNTSPEEAIEAIGSALRGEMEPIRKYGVILDDATLKQVALKEGIISTTKEALTPAQKVLAAQAAIYERTSDAQNDFEKTNSSLSNQMKISTATLEDWKTKVGQVFLPAVESGAQALNSLMLAAEDLAKQVGESEWFAELQVTLKDFAENVLPPLQAGFNQLVETLTPLWNELKQNQEVLDALKIAAVVLVVAIVAIVAAIGLLVAASIGVTAVVSSLVIGSIIALRAVFTLLASAISTVIGFFMALAEIAGRVATEMAGAISTGFNNLVNIVTTGVEKVKSLIAGMIDFIVGVGSRGFGGIFDGLVGAFKWAVNAVLRAWNDIAFTFPTMDIPGFGTVGGWRFDTPNIATLAEGGIVRRPTLALIGEAGPEAVVPLGRATGGNATNINVTINHTGLAVDSPRLQRDIVGALNRYVAREGRLNVG